MLFSERKFFSNKGLMGCKSISNDSIHSSTRHFFQISSSVFMIHIYKHHYAKKKNQHHRSQDSAWIYLYCEGLSQGESCNIIILHIMTSQFNFFLCITMFVGVYFKNEREVFTQIFQNSILH